MTWCADGTCKGSQAECDCTDTWCEEKTSCLASADQCACNDTWCAGAAGGATCLMSTEECTCKSDAAKLWCPASMTAETEDEKCVAGGVPECTCASLFRVWCAPSGKTAKCVANA